MGKKPLPQRLGEEVSVGNVGLRLGVLTHPNGAPCVENKNVGLAGTCSVDGEYLGLRTGEFDAAEMRLDGCGEKG